VDELVGLLSQQGQIQTLRSTRQLSSDAGSNTVWHHDPGLKYLSFTSMLVAYYISYIYISQGSVATSLRCGGMFTNRFVANFSDSVGLKNFENGLIFGKVRRFFRD